MEARKSLPSDCCDAEMTDFICVHLVQKVGTWEIEKVEKLFSGLLFLPALLF